MRRVLSRIGVAVLMIVTFTTGCTERGLPTSQDAVAVQQDNLIGSLVNALLVPVLQRLTPLRSDETATAMIDERGGSLRLQRAGALVTIPAGALRERTQITVTAIKGRNVAFIFGPHGTTFDKPVRIEVSVENTLGLLDLLLGKRLYAAYVPRGRDGIAADGMAEVTEILPTNVDRRQKKAIFDVRHFSGYILATGRSSR